MATANDWSGGIAWLTTSAWAYPALEVTHIAGIALMLGSLVLVELRVWGHGAELSAAALARAGLRVTLTGFALVAASGLLLFAANPGELLTNPAFRIKLALLALAGANAGLFHWRGSLWRADAVAKAQTVLSLGSWLAVIICGRAIAYV